MMSGKQGTPASLMFLTPASLMFLLFNTFFYLTMVKISFIICSRQAMSGRVNLAYSLFSEPGAVEDRQGRRFENHPGALTLKAA